MARICYKPHRFSAASAAIIHQANAICAEYKRAGYDLTLFLAAREQEDRWRLAIGRLIDQHGDALDQEVD